MNRLSMEGKKCLRFHKKKDDPKMNESHMNLERHESVQCVIVDRILIDFKNENSVIIYNLYLSILSILFGARNDLQNIFFVCSTKKRKS